MSEKVRYSEQKDAVSIIRTDEKMLNVILCLNETVVSIEDETEESGFRMEYEYDFNFFITNTLTEEEIQAHPEDYLEYSQNFYQGENLEDSFAAKDLWNVAQGSITPELIAPGAIKTEHIGEGVITAEQLKDGTVTEDKIALGAISANRLNLTTHILT